YQEIEALRIEGINGRIRKNEVQRQVPWRKLPGPCQHRRRDVDAKHKALWSDLLGERNAGCPATASDVEDAITRLCARAIDQNFRNRREQDVLGRLPLGPVLAARSIPVSDLIGVAIVTNRRIHWNSRQGGNGRSR